MAPQQQDNSRSGNELSWLATLIESFERVSRSDIRATPCDPSVLMAVREQLARPAAARPADAGHSPAWLRSSGASDLHSPANCSRGRWSRSTPRNRASSRMI